MSSANVLRISEAASLALHTVVMLAARPDRPVSTPEIASVFRVSEAHLAKVLQRLSRAGLVRSVRGPKGGFFLEREADELTLLDVYEAIEGPLPSSECLLGSPICGGEKCILGELLGSLNREVRDYLAGTTLSDLTGAFEALYEKAAPAAPEGDT